MEIFPIELDSITSAPELSEFTSGQILAGQIVNGIASTLSLIGGIFMMYTYFTNRLMKSFPMKLVMSQVCCGFIYTITNFMIYIPGGLCVIQGVLRTASEISSILWALTITYISYDHVHNFQNKWEERYPRILQIIVALSIAPPIAALISMYAGGDLKIQHLTLACTLAPEVFNFSLVYAPMWVCIILILFFSIKTRYKLKALMEGNLDSEFGRIFWYPIILALLWLPNTIESFINLLPTDPDSFVLFLFHFSFSRLLGFVNCLVYGNYYTSNKEDEAPQTRYRDISMTESRGSEYDFKFRSTQFRD